MVNIYTPKRPCPRDLGYWYCDDCREKYLEEQSNCEYPFSPTACGRKFGENQCGTHQGSGWCDECKTKGTFVPHPHWGEFVIVGTIQERCLD